MRHQSHKWKCITSGSVSAEAGYSSLNLWCIGINTKIFNTCLFIFFYLLQASLTFLCDFTLSHSGSLVPVRAAEDAGAFSYLLDVTVELSPSCPAGVLVHSAVLLSAMVSSPAPHGPKWPIWTVALPAGPESATEFTPWARTLNYIQYYILQ